MLAQMDSEEGTRTILVAMVMVVIHDELDLLIIFNEFELF